MASAYIETITELALSFRDNERNLRLYFPDLETAPRADSLNRVFGPPVGLTDEQWPTFPELGELMQQARCMNQWDPSDERMEHVFTVDLRDVSLLGAPRDAVAMTLFISKASFHRANQDGNPHTAVMFLREEDLHRGVYRGQLPRRSLSRWSRRFSLVAIDVPGEVFDAPELDLPVDDPLSELYDAIGMAPARLGGCPIWVKEPPRESSPTNPFRPSDSAPPRAHLTACSEPRLGGRRRHAPHNSSLTVPYDSRLADPQPGGLLDSNLTVPYDPRLLDANRTVVYEPRESALNRSGRESTPFLMQFQRRFADVNLGSAGVMYVSGHGAYCQSH